MTTVQNVFLIIALLLGMVSILNLIVMSAEIESLKTENERLKGKADFLENKVKHLEDIVNCLGKMQNNLVSDIQSKVETLLKPNIIKIKRRW